MSEDAESIHLPFSRVSSTNHRDNEGRSAALTKQWEGERFFCGTARRRDRGQRQQHLGAAKRSRVRGGVGGYELDLRSVRECAGHEQESVLVRIAIGCSELEWVRASRTDLQSQRTGGSGTADAQASLGLASA